MVVETSDFTNYHEVFCNTDDISGASEIMTDKAKDEKWRHGSKATDVETGDVYLWDADSEVWNKI